MAPTHFVIWNNESIGSPPARRSVVFKYPEVEKVLLSFSIDFAVNGSSRSYLDPIKPVTINGKTLKIQDLPSDPTSLRVVDRTDLDITPMVKTSAEGSDNIFEVNYIAGDRSFLRRHVGVLTLSVTVVTPERKLVRYCFFCGAQNEVGAKQCSRCGRLLEVGGEQTTACPKCGETIPLRPDIRFCDKCGALQEVGPSVQLKTKTCKKCGATIEAEALYCSKCGSPQ